MRILVTDGMDKTAMAELKAQGHEVVEQFYEPDQLGAALREFDAVVVRSKTKVRANHIDEAKGGKLKLGPVWDYDICGGYGFPNPNLLIMESDWFLALYQVPEFRALYCSRFRTYYPRVLEELDKLDAVRDANAEAIARNNAVWPVETYIYPMTDIMKSFTTYEQHYEYFKDYVRARCDFLKRNLD